MATAGRIDARVVRGGIGRHIVAVVVGVGDEQRLGNLGRDNLQFHAVLGWGSHTRRTVTCGVGHGSGNLLQTSADCIAICLNHRLYGFEHEGGGGLG